MTVMRYRKRIKTEDGVRVIDHHKDEHCRDAFYHSTGHQRPIPSEEWICPECGVYHGDPCPECSGRGFHKAECGRNSGYYLVP